MPASLDNAARVLEAAREMKRKLNLVVAEATSYLMEQSQREGTKTFHTAHGNATLSGGPTVEYDPTALMHGLGQAGCPEARITEAVTPEVTYKVNRSVLRQLAAANQKYDLAIRQAEYTVEKPYRVSVKP